MKTTNGKTKFKKSMKTFITAGAIVSSTWLLAACPGNNDKSNPQAPQNPGYYNCTNCGTITGQEFVSTESVEYNNMFTLRLGFGGAANQQGGYQNTYPNTAYPNNGYNYPNGYPNTYPQNYYSPSNYQGQVAVTRGDLTVTQPLSQWGYYQGYCTVPVGTYVISTLQAGSYSAGIFQGLILNASGPANLVIRMNVAQYASPNNRDQYGMLLPFQRLLSMNTVIESVNGQLCNIAVNFQ